MLLTLGTLLLSGVTVTLPMEAEVAGTEIELGEVASITGAVEAEVALVSGLEVGYAPAPGYSRLLRADRLAAEVARRLPELEVRFEGHAACRVRPHVARIAPADVEQAVRIELARLHGPGEASFALRTPIPDVLVPLGSAPPVLRVRLDVEGLTTGLLSVPVEVHVDGLPYRTVWTSWTAEVWQTVPVLSRPVVAGETLTADMFERSRVRYAGRAGARPVDATQVTGSVAARDLRPGEVLTDLEVHRPVLVERGRGVFLAVRKGRITARVPALALESGAAGDAVRVRTIHGEKEMEGRVVRRDLIEIDLGD